VLWLFTWDRRCRHLCTLNRRSVRNEWIRVWWWPLLGLCSSLCSRLRGEIFRRHAKRRMQSVFSARALVNEDTWHVVVLNNSSILGFWPNWEEKIISARQLIRLRAGHKTKPAHFNYSTTMISPVIWSPSSFLLLSKLEIQMVCQAWSRKCVRPH
jgi:hypothetical protein